jgi:hypothetical protein
MIEVNSLINEATRKAGSLRALARALDWTYGSIQNVKAGEKISPYRAAQLAEYVFGDDTYVQWAVIGALLQMAKSHGEADFWKAQWQKLHDHLGKNLLAELDKLAKAPKVKDTGDYISPNFLKRQGK